MLNFIKFSKYCVIFSIVLTLVGIAAFIYHGMVLKDGFLVMDQEFKGGSTIEVTIGKSFNTHDIADIVKKAAGVEPTVQTLGANQQKVAIKTTVLTQKQINDILTGIKTKYNLKEDITKVADRIQTVEPTIGKEIWGRGLMAVALSSVIILLYLAYRFRTMAGLSSGTTAVVALLHDAFIMFTVYSLLRIPVNSTFIAAVLTVLGYSIHDTIIVYDRIRENQRLLRKLTPEELANKSIGQTLTRSINTVVTVLICVVTLYIFGYINGIQSIKEFTLPLIIGMVSGAYSSVFIASPLWVWWQNAVNKANTTKKKSSKAKLA